MPLRARNARRAFTKTNLYQGLHDLHTNMIPHALCQKKQKKTKDILQQLHHEMDRISTENHYIN
jgi:hypothetical protein